MSKKDESLSQKEKDYVKKNVDATTKELAKEVDASTSAISEYKKEAVEEVKQEKKSEEKAKEVPKKKTQAPRKNKKVEDQDSQKTGERRPIEPEPSPEVEKIDDAPPSPLQKTVANNNGSRIMNPADSQHIDYSMKKKKKLPSRLDGAIHKIR